MRSFSTFRVEQEDLLSSEAVAIRRRQVETLGRRVPVVIAGNLVGSTLITAIVWQHTAIIVHQLLDLIGGVLARGRQ